MRADDSIEYLAATAGDRDIPAETVNVTRYDGAAGLAALRRDWERLTQSLSTPRFFHFYGWYESYLGALESDPDSVHFFVVCRDGSPVGIFPLKRTLRRVHGVSLRCLEFPEHGQLMLGDGIFESAGANVALIRVLVNHLRHESEIDWDILTLQHTLDDSAISRSMKIEPPSRLVSMPSRLSHYFVCPGTPEELSCSMSGSFRRNLRRLERRAQETGHLEYRSYRAPEDLDAAFSEFVAVEGSGWKRGWGTAIVCLSSLRKFYSRLIRHYSPHGGCVINLLRLNGACIAGQFGLLINDVLYVLKVGYQDEYAQLAPGNLLMRRVLEDSCHGAPWRTVSVVTAPRWSELWRPRAWIVWDHYVFNGTARGWMFWFIRWGASVTRRLISGDRQRHAADDQA